VQQSFLSISPHLLAGTMATSQKCCHLSGKMLNSSAECADRARIYWTLKWRKKASDGHVLVLGNEDNSFLLELPFNYCIYIPPKRTFATEKTQEDVVQCLSPLYNYTSPWLVLWANWQPCWTLSSPVVCSRRKPQVKPCFAAARDARGRKAYINPFWMTYSCAEPRWVGSGWRGTWVG
jgi:hypothetical protein